jgi:hypothetical protein
MAWRSRGRQLARSKCDQSKCDQNDWGDRYQNAIKMIGAIAPSAQFRRSACFDRKKYTKKVSTPRTTVVYKSFRESIVFELPGSTFA